MSAELDEMMAVVDSDFARGNDDVAEVAQEWIDAGFAVAEAGQWLAARCFRADAAAELRDAGVSSAGARRIWAGQGGTQTIGEAVANGYLDADDAADLTRQQD